MATQRRASIHLLVSSSPRRACGRTNNISCRHEILSPVCRGRPLLVGSAGYTFLVFLCQWGKKCLKTSTNVSHRLNHCWSFEPWGRLLSADLHCFLRPVSLSVVLNGDTAQTNKRKQHMCDAKRGYSCIFFPHATLLDYLIIKIVTLFYHRCFALWADRDLEVICLSVRPEVAVNECTLKRLNFTDDFF